MANSSQQPQRHYPGRFGRIFLLGVEEVLSAEETSQIFNQVGKPADWLAHLPTDDSPAIEWGVFERILASLRVQFGEQAGRGLAARIGRASFRHGLTTYGEQLGLLEPVMRLQPARLRITQALQAMASLYQSEGGAQISVEETADAWLWHQLDGPDGYFLAGLLQEALYWLSNGKLYPVEAIAGTAAGNGQAVFRISRTPLE